MDFGIILSVSYLWCVDLRYHNGLFRDLLYSFKHNQRWRVLCNSKI
ncbi:Uncharacterised protein [Vibrio cholerae]|nr:Uncharacterised protein [Vibrio cholerae]